MTIKKLEKRVEEQQEQIDILIELSNNMVERFAFNQKEIAFHRKAIEDLIHNTELDKTQLDSIQLASEYDWHGKPTDDSIIN